MSQWRATTSSPCLISPVRPQHLENHIEYVLQENGLRYSRTAVTERNCKPDFLFPGKADYHDATFSSARLTMLGVKSTCKDRWRQILSESDRIEVKHLLTLESPISSSQTEEMGQQKVQLIVPGGLHGAFNKQQQGWLWKISDFLDLVRSRQES